MKRRFIVTAETTPRRTLGLADRWFSSWAFATGAARQPAQHSRLSPRCPSFQTRMVNDCNMSLFLQAYELNPFTFGRSSSRCFSTESVQDTADVVRADFWGEPVTFLSSTVRNSEDSPETSLAAMDDFSIAVVSKGSSCSGGGDDEGVPTMAAHSAAIVWAECLRQAAVWHSSAPMLAVAAVGPLLTHANVGYLQTLDSLLEQADSGVQAHVSLVNMAKTAAEMKDDDRLTPREKDHLQALHHMLRHERREALDILVGLLQQAPGDALALCLAIDLANAIGDPKSAMRYVSSPTYIELPFSLLSS